MTRQEKIARNKTLFLIGDKYEIELFADIIREKQPTAEFIDFSDFEQTRARVQKAIKEKRIAVVTGIEDDDTRFDLELPHNAINCWQHELGRDLCDYPCDYMLGINDKQCGSVERLIDCALKNKPFRADNKTKPLIGTAE